MNDYGINQMLRLKRYLHSEARISKSAFDDITTLALALCGGVALVALAACGLVLCAHEREAVRRDAPRAYSDPPLCAYNTEGWCSRCFVANR